MILILEVYYLGSNNKIPNHLVFNFNIVSIILFHLWSFNVTFFKTKSKNGRQFNKLFNCKNAKHPKVRQSWRFHFKFVYALLLLPRHWFLDSVGARIYSFGPSRPIKNSDSLISPPIQLVTELPRVESMATSPDRDWMSPSSCLRILSRISSLSKK